MLNCRSKENPTSPSDRLAPHLGGDVVVAEPLCRRVLAVSDNSAWLSPVTLSVVVVRSVRKRPKEVKNVSEFSFARSIPVRHEVDVVVAGGGPAGVAAALAAARQGCSVFLFDSQNCFGGMGTAGLVPAFMQFSDGVNFLAAGIGEEIHTKLRDAGGTGPDNAMSIRVEVFKRLYDQLITAEENITVSLQTQMIAVEQQDANVSHLILAAKSGIYAVTGTVFVDGTGDGDLAAWAGAPFELGDEAGNMMPGTVGSLWGGIDWSRVKKPDSRRFDDAFAENVFSVQDRHLPGMWRVGHKLGGGNIGHTFGVDSTDERSVTRALIQGRRDLTEYERYYKEYLDGYEDMELVCTGSVLGIRESRRIMGDYVLCLDDFNNRATFEDEIGRYSYPVDIHASKPSEENYAKFLDEFKNLRYGRGENYGIPYRSMLPRELKNVLVAGRCISSDRYMQGSVRVMPGCYITGQAAGVAAALALAAAGDVRQIAVTELQKRLKAMGAFLPNYSAES